MTHQKREKNVFLSCGIAPVVDGKVYLKDGPVLTQKDLEKLLIEVRIQQEAIGAPTGRHG